MSYRSETKRFWKTGYKLFHSKFLYFMGGPKNANQIKDGVDQKSCLSTDSAKINFIVPSVNVLSDFNKSDISFLISIS